MKRFSVGGAMFFGAVLEWCLSGSTQAAVMITTIPYGEQWVHTDAFPGTSRYRMSLDMDGNGTEDFFLIADRPFASRLGTAGGNRITGYELIVDGDPGGVATFLPPSSIVGTDTLEEGVKWWNGPEGDAGFLARGAEDEDPPDIRYVGLEFSAEDGLHYGYVRLRFIYNSTFLLERAWETEPGRPITIPVPEPSGAALAVMGCVLAVASRRRKTQRLPHCE